MSICRLSDRLKEALSLLPDACFLADVGSDHAKLVSKALLEGKAVKAIAIENKKAPYERSRKTIRELALADKAEVSLSDGLNELPDWVDTVAILGMGGLLTCSILERSKERLSNVRTMILDPHRDAPKVRLKIVELGYRITDERMLLEDGIYYSLMKVEKGAPERPYSDVEIEFGPLNILNKSGVFLSFIKERINELKGILSNPIPDGKKKDCLLKIEQMEGLL